jgi:hypothetical protein
MALGLLLMYSFGQQVVIVWGPTCRWGGKKHMQWLDGRKTCAKMNCMLTSWIVSTSYDKTSCRGKWDVTLIMLVEFLIDVGWISRIFHDKWPPASVLLSSSFLKPTFPHVAGRMLRKNSLWRCLELGLLGGFARALAKSSTICRWLTLPRW